MTDLFTLAGQRALVTGGTRGIGRAISIRFAAAGASVIANYVRDQESAQTLKQQADASGYRLEVCRADVTSPKGVDTLPEAVDAGGSGVSIFVHCAATGVHRPLGEFTLRHFDWTYALNARAFLDLTQRLIPRMASPGSILTISSEGAARALPQYALVGSSKGALESMARHFAVELAPRGVRVNTLSAGAVLTDAWKALPDAERRLSEAASRSPLGRLTSVEEIAAAAQFLCSPAACGIVGQTLTVDGGIGIVGGR